MTGPETAATVDAGALVELRNRAETGDRLHRELARRVGVPADAAPDVLLAALGEALAEAADPSVAEDDRAGTVRVDAAALADLQADAELGRGWRHRQLLDDAIRAGKFPPAMRPSWEALLLVDAASAERALDRLRPGLIPMREVGIAATGDELDT